MTSLAINILVAHYAPIRTVQIHSTNTTNAGEDTEQQKLSFIPGRKLLVQDSIFTLKDSLTVSHKTK